MADQTNTNDIKIIPYRREGQTREYSTFVEVTTNAIDVSIKFCDLMPPENIDGIEKVKKEGRVYIPIISEIVLPRAVAQSFLDILKQQLEVQEDKS